MTETVDIIETLEAFVSENKQCLIDQVLAKRTRHVTLVFENIHNPHNVSAVLRTAECMGIQDVHFMDNTNNYSLNSSITQGATKWITIHHYDQLQNNVVDCYQSLRDNDYSIYVTSPQATSQSIYDLNHFGKIALVLGTEVDGITKEAREKADGLVHIPMSGFTESFNLSVSAAICLTALKLKIGQWPCLSEEEKLTLKAQWYRKIVRESDLILKTKGIDI